MAANFDPNFYVTCATVIPVLFLAAAAQGAAAQGSAYDSIMKAWQKAEQTSQEASRAALEAVQVVLQAGQPGGDPGGDVQQAAQAAQAAVEASGEAGGHAVQAAAMPSPWVLMRGAGAAIASPVLRVIAAAIVLAGGAGEGLALYVLYRGSQQRVQRELVFAATLILLAAVVAAPLLSFLLRFFKGFGFVLTLPKKVLPGKRKAADSGGGHAGDG